jgi:hypothetical protein
MAIKITISNQMMACDKQKTEIAVYHGETDGLPW